MTLELGIISWKVMQVVNEEPISFKSINNTFLTKA